MTIADAEQNREYVVTSHVVWAKDKDGNIIWLEWAKDKSGRRYNGVYRRQPFGDHPPLIGSRRPESSLIRSIWSVYADYGTQWQEVAIPSQHGRIEAGRATAVQK